VSSMNDTIGVAASHSAYGAAAIISCRVLRISLLEIVDRGVQTGS
jgi:hypothetical protein